jgi:hypothetical protein
LNVRPGTILGEQPKEQREFRTTGIKCKPTSHTKYETMEVNAMPKNEADPKYDREDNRADKKKSQQNHANFTEEAQTLSSINAADSVPSLNGIPKNQV